MFEQRRLSLADIAIGEPLPWDVFGEGNKLLLRRGQVVQNIRQVESLLARGLFVDAGLIDRAVQIKREERERAAKLAEQPSALRFVNLSVKRLERLLYNLANETDVQTKVLEVVKALNYATDINTDVTLACLLLNQASASYAVRHCVDAALLALQVARSMKKPPEEIQAIMAACLTMNVSKLRQHDQYQLRPEPLSEKDKEFVKNHAQESVRLLQQAGVDNPLWLEYVRMHHELDDTAISCSGLVTAEIPQNAKIVSLADRYCAAVSSRKYRKTLTPAAALRDVFVGNGKPTDPMLAALFIKELGAYPPGSMVRLQCGEIGVVTRRGNSPAKPVVHSLIGPRGAPLSFPIQRDTSKELHAVREAVPNELATVRVSMQQLWGNDAAL
jgi:HD-GYP domain-containing protein (c-di-GMP phosphodiesterase class II)